MSAAAGVIALTALGDLLLGAGATYATYAAAKEAFNAEEVPVWNNEGVAIGAAYTADGGPAQAASSASQTALEMAQTTDLSASDIQIDTAAITFAEGENDTVKAVGVVCVDEAMALATAAPVLGVSIDADLSETNPTLWQKCVDVLRNYAYKRAEDLTYAIPLIAIPSLIAGTSEVSWTVGMLKSIIEALKGLFDEEGIGPAQDSVYTYDGASWAEGMEIYPFNSTSYRSEPPNVSNWATVVVTSPVQMFRIENSVAAVSKTLSNVSITVTNYYDDGRVAETTYTASSSSKYVSLISGDTFYYRSFIVPARADAPVSVGSPSIRQGGSILLDGTESGGPGYFPVGTSQWEGNTPSTIPTSGRVLVGVDDFGLNIYEPITPVSVTTAVPENYAPDYGYPKGSVASNDPEVYPDTNITADPEKQVEPYIQPMPVPWVSPIPNAATGQGVSIYDIFRNPSIARDLDIVLTDVAEMVANAVAPMVPYGKSPSLSLPGGRVPNGAIPFSSGGGVVTVYHPTAQQLYDFEIWLWVTLSQASVNTVWNNPFDGVITLFELYCTPSDVGTRNIHSGFLDSGINSNVISRYVEINCGTLGIPEYYGNYFDYSPYTQAHIYLPFIGVQELNPDDIVGHAVNVTYRIDCYNGSCIALITVAKVTEVAGEEVEYSNLMYQFSGNCSVEMPIAGGSQAAIKAGLMQADAYQQANTAQYRANLVGGIASALMGALTGSPGFLAGAVSTFANTLAMPSSARANYLSNMLSGKSTVQKSGTFSASHGALGVKIPFITITRPKQVQVTDYNKLYGFPAHKMVQIGACSGFLRCREVHVISATATDEEKSKIESLLKNGVYISEDE